MNGEPIVIAVDCDLRRIHAWCSSCGLLGTSLQDPRFVTDHALVHLRGMRDRTVVLFEIASPMSMAGNRVGGAAMATNVMKWAIYNAAMAATMHQNTPDGAAFLVSPSSSWTLGYDVKTRHKIANATAKNKDLRECQAMIHFHAKNPAKWRPFPDYLNAL